MTELTWEQVSEMQNLVGGFLVVVTPNGRYSGPIDRISIKGSLDIGCKWTAHLKQGKWILNKEGPNGVHGTTLQSFTNLRLEGKVITFEIAAAATKFFIHRAGGWSIERRDVLDK